MEKIKNKLRVVHFPQVGSLKKAFTVEVKDEHEAFKIMTTLADQHIWLEKNKVIPDYSNVIFVEMWDENSDGKGKGEWCDYYNEEELMDWDEFEQTYLSPEIVEN